MFRKTVVNRSDGFSIGPAFFERKNVVNNSYSRVVHGVTRDVSVSELALDCLPLVSLDDILESGNVIHGNVDFTPSDPTSYNDVQDVLGVYAQSVLEHRSPSVESPSVTPPVES